VQAPSNGGGGGGGSGGGGGGLPPDLHVDISASASSGPRAVGSELDVYVTVSTKNAGGSSAVKLDLALPTGYTLKSTYTDRGGGCTGAAPSLTCDVAWINADAATHVTVFGSVAQAGELDFTATVTSLLEPEYDAGDNTLTLKLVLPAARPATPSGGGPTAPTVKAAPLVSGKPAPGGTLRAAPAKWSSTPASVAYRWQLCRGTVCTAITGATKTTLRVAKAYVGHSVRIVAIAAINGTTVKSASRKVAIRKR
jgi:hypothetical protein